MAYFLATALLLWAGALCVYRLSTTKSADDDFAGMLLSAGLALVAGIVTGAYLLAAFWNHQFL